MALSADGSTLAATLDQPSPRDAGAQIWFWNARTLQKLKPLGVRPAPGKGQAVNFALALAPDGQEVAFAPRWARGSQTFALYQRATGRRKWKLNGFFWNAPARFSPDGRRLAVIRGAKPGAEYLVLRAADGQVLASWKSLAFSDSAVISWAPDGVTLACAGAVGAPVTQDNILGRTFQTEIRRASDGQLLHSWPSLPLQSLHFAPDGRALVAVTFQRASGAGYFDFQVVALDTTGHERWRYGAIKGAVSRTFFNEARFSPDGKWVAAIASISGQIFLLDAHTGALQRTLTLAGHYSSTLAFDSPDALAFSPDSKRLFARGLDAVLVWDLD